MQKFQPTEELRTTLLELIRAGKTNKEIGERYGVTKQTITVWFRRLGISAKDYFKYRKKKLCEGDKIKIIEMYEQGKTSKEIAKSFSISYGTLLTFQRAHNIKARSYFEHRLDYDVHIFNKIDTEEKAYWLGFLYADGNVRKEKLNNSVVLYLNAIDIGHLKKFKAFMKDTRDESVIKIQHRLSPNGNPQTVCSYMVCNDNLRNDLISHGCVPAKSLILTFPEESHFESPDLIIDFIRGYIDGDGCLSSSKGRPNSVSISARGTFDFLSGIIKYFPEFGVVHSEYDKRFNTTQYKIYCTGGKARKVANKLYGHATIYLDRKFEKFTALFKYKDSETSGNIGEVCDDNTEIIDEITKGSSTS